MREGDFKALRDDALAGASSRRSLLDKRTFEAIDQLWGAYVVMTALRTAADRSIYLKPEAAVAVARGDKATKLFVDGMGNVDFKTSLSPDAIKAKPFISPLAWSIFSAYQTLVVLGSFRLHAIQEGIEWWSMYRRIRFTCWRLLALAVRHRH